MSEIKEGHVGIETQKGITTIEFAHPRSNSLPGDLLAALTRHVEEAGADEKTTVIVLRSAGEKAFCAGASFDELMAIGNEAEGFHFFSGFAHLINAMRKCPRLIIARVQGKCVGGGVGIAAAADYVLAQEGADIKLSELAVGIGPFVVGPAVERKMGMSAFCELSIDAASWRSASWALGKGLYAELHPDTVALDLAVERLSQRLAVSNPEAMAAMKQTYWQGTEHWNELLIERAAISGKLVLSPFCKKAIAAFKQK